MSTATQLTGAAAPGSPFRWKPGQPSANPGGRQRGLERIAREVVERHGGYPALVEFLVDVAIGRLSNSANVRIQDRIKATEMLLDRGYGRPRVTVDLTAELGAPTVDPGDYSSEQVRAVAAILTRPALPPPIPLLETLDAQAREVTP